MLVGKIDSLTIFFLSLLIVFSSGQPQPVWTDNCITVNNNTGTCIQCVAGFYLEYFLCLPCAPLCTCSSQYNYCQSCISALSYNGTNYTFSPLFSQQFGRCFLCDHFIQYCMSCNSTTFCRQCYGGYFPITTVNGSNGTTSSCTGKCSNFCQICINQSSCRLCLPGYFLDPNTKACLGQCGPNCTECLNISTCKSCLPGFFFNSTITTCQSCNISECILCGNGTQCTNCTPGNYPVNGSCMSTGIDNCVLYVGGAEQASGCQICQPGYFVLYSTCYRCVGCELCSLQFLCHTKCFANATPFNYACLVPQSLFGAGVKLWILLWILIGFMMM